MLCFEMLNYFLEFRINDLVIDLDLSDRGDMSCENLSYRHSWREDKSSSVRDRNDDEDDHESEVPQRVGSPMIKYSLTEEHSRNALVQSSFRGIQDTMTRDGLKVERARR